MRREPQPGDCWSPGAGEGSCGDNWWNVSSSWWDTQTSVPDWMHQWIVICRRISNDLFLIRGLCAEPQGRRVKQQRYCIDSALNEVSEGDRRALISPWFPPSPSDPPWFSSSPVLFTEGLEGSIERTEVRPTFLKQSVCKNIRRSPLLSPLALSGPGAAPVNMCLGILTPFRVRSWFVSLRQALRFPIKPCANESTA